MQRKPFNIHTSARAGWVTGGIVAIGLFAAIAACVSPTALSVTGDTAPDNPTPTLITTAAPPSATPTETPLPPTATSTNTPTSTLRPTFTPLPTYAPTSPPQSNVAPAPIVIIETATPQVTDTPTPTPEPTDETPVCGYDSTANAYATIPNGTELLAGSTLTKVWRLKNNGCRGWPRGTTLVFVSGKQMGGPDSIAVAHTNAGDKQDVSVDLTAPARPGTYTGWWQLETPDGTLFGETFEVQIKSVAAPGPLTFDTSYDSAWTCSGTPDETHYSIAIDNTSPLISIESASWTLKNAAGKKIATGQSDTPFQSVVSATSCADPSLTGASLAAGSSGWISALTTGTPLASGKTAHIELKLCSEDNLKGTCKSTTIAFTP